MKQSPQVGIFWMNPDLESLFYASKQELSEGQSYFDWIIARDDHADLWDRLRSSGDLSGLPRRHRDDYSLLPRGRVSYNTKTKRYVVYHGNWLIKNTKRLIMDLFHLPKRSTDFELDEHYRI